MIPQIKRPIVFDHPIEIPIPILYRTEFNETKRGNYNSVDIFVNRGMRPTLQDFVTEVDNQIKIHKPDSVVFRHIFEYYDVDLSWDSTESKQVLVTDSRETTFNLHKFQNMTFKDYVNNIMDLKFKEMYGEAYDTYDKLGVVAESIEVSKARLWIPRVGHGSEEASESFDVIMGDTVYHVVAVSESASRTCFYDVLRTYINSEVVEALKHHINSGLRHDQQDGMNEQMLKTLHHTLCDYSINIVTPTLTSGSGIVCRMMLHNGHWVRIVDSSTCHTHLEASHLIVTYDFETVDDKPYMFSIYDPIHGATVVYDSTPDTESFNEKVKRLIDERAAKGVTFVGFNSSVYDDLYLLRILNLTEWMVMKGSGNSILTMKHRKSGATFVDVCRFLKMSLSKACKMLGIENPKLSLDHNLVKEQYLKDNYVNVTDHMIRYSKRDVTALYDVWTKAKQLFAEKFNMNAAGCMTLSQMSYRKFIKNNGKDVPQITVKMDSYGYKQGFREFLTGGKCDARKGIHVRKQGIRVYDVNSLYPHVMMSKTFIHRATNWRRSTVFVWHGVYKVKVTELAEPCVIPLRNADNILDWQPRECYEAYASGIDIEEHLKYGGTLEILDGFSYESITESTTMFDFLKDIAEIKRLTPDPATRDIAKLLMNSLSGKMTQENITHEHVFSLDIPLVPDHTAVPKTRFYINAIEKSNVTVTGSFINGVLIYSYARALLNSHLSQCPEWFYCDTDSVFTTSILETSDSLGAMKLEATGTKLYVGGKKMYTLLDSDGKVVKSALKGVHRVEGYYNDDTEKTPASEWLVRAMDSGVSKFTVKSEQCMRTSFNPHFASVPKTMHLDN